MPCEARLCGGSVNRSTCPSSARPLAGKAPISARISVVLPAPLRPISPHISPSFTASEASRMIGIGPIETLRLATLSMAGAPGRGLDLDAAHQLLNLRIIQRLGGRSVSYASSVVEGE